MQYVKFFDGMDDDGSEFNFHSLMLLLYSFSYSVLFLDSPLLRSIIMNGGMLFQILGTVGNSSRTVKMEENHQWSSRIL